jgi:sulfide dehydrogenase cytochrome subunit
MNPFRRIAPALFALSFATTAPAVDQKIIGQCEGCHGEKGVSQWTDVPTIAGVPEGVQEDALYAYRDSDRPCPKSEYRAGDTTRPATDMCAVAKNLSDEQIKEVAAYYAAKPFVPAKQQTDAAKAAMGKEIHDKTCEQCHTDGGRNPEDDAGILGGQMMGYLRESLKEFKAGKREMPRSMAKKIEALSADQIEMLVQYYGSLQ